MSKNLSNLIKAFDKDVVDAQSPILKNTKGALLCICGKKRTGKSSLWLSMLSHPALYKGYFDNIFLISPSQSDQKITPLINELKKEQKYFDCLTEENIKYILNIISQEAQQKKLYEIKTKKKLPDTHNLLILDDVIESIPKSYKKNLITSLFYNQRHYNLTIILISQAFKLINPSIRKQIDALYIFPMSNKKEIEAIQEDYSIPSEIFDYCFEDETDHPFLTVNLCGAKPIYFRKLEKLNV